MYYSHQVSFVILPSAHLDGTCEIAPSIFVKLLCNLLLCNKLRLQRFDFAFRLDFFEIKAPASRRISDNSTSYKDFILQTNKLTLLYVRSFEISGYDVKSGEELKTTKLQAEVM